MSPSRTLLALASLGAVVCASLGATTTSAEAATPKPYPLHRSIVATTFWVGEIFDAKAADGSQMISTYDDHWYKNYGGCDGIKSKNACRTEKRVSSNGYFPRHMKPKQNPFYVDLPYDDLNDAYGYKYRGNLIPWAKKEPYKSRIKDSRVSLMKDRWVKISRGGRHCYAQIEDAGPGLYHDHRYVFGTKDQRPSNKRYGHAGMDVSPAVNGCLKFKSLDGDSDRVAWRFVEAKDVPNGPWKKIVTKTKWPAAR